MARSLRRARGSLALLAVVLCAACPREMYFLDFDNRTDSAIVVSRGPERVIEVPPRSETPVPFAGTKGGPCSAVDVDAEFRRAFSAGLTFTTADGRRAHLDLADLRARAAEMSDGSKVLVLDAATFR